MPVIILKDFMRVKDFMPVIILKDFMPVIILKGYRVIPKTNKE